MLIMGFMGSEIHEHSPITEWLLADGLGGVLLFDKDVASGAFGKNLQSQSQIKQLIHQLNHYAMLSSEEGDNKLPLLTAIDYEGGVIDRLAHIDGCMTTMSPWEMAQLSPEALEAEFKQMADTLKNLGFNLNFAPVVDLNLQKERGIIGALKRSFAENPEIVAHIAKKFVTALSDYGIATCYKHFPGHGSALGDTHEGFVDVTDTFDDKELIPYYRLVGDVFQPTMIMTAHVINRNLDPHGLPATLSHAILTNLLRDKINYDGIIISDDLQMQAISDHYSLDEALMLTINAGADMIIFANQLDHISAFEVIERIERLVLQQKIAVERIEQAYRRIVRLKQSIST